MFNEFHSKVCSWNLKENIMFYSSCQNCLWVNSTDWWLEFTESRWRVFWNWRERDKNKTLLVVTKKGIIVMLEKIRKLKDKTSKRRQWQDYTRISMRQEGHESEGRISEGSGFIYSSWTIVHVCYHYYDYLTLDWQDERQNKHFNCSILLITTSLVFAFIIKERTKGKQEVERRKYTHRISFKSQERTNKPARKQLKL